MPGQNPLNTEIVLSGDGNNETPIATGPFKRAWNRISSALGPRRHDAGEDQIESGEQAVGTLHVGEGNHEEDVEAGATPPDGPPAEATKGQQHSSFSSSAFDRLPQPVPVIDVFFGSWWLISALRTVTRPVMIYFSIFWLWTTFFDGLVSTIIVAIFLFRWSLLLAGRDTIPLVGASIPGKRQLFWALFRWIQKIWVCPLSGFFNY